MILPVRGSSESRAPSTLRSLLKTKLRQTELTNLFHADFDHVADFEISPPATLSLIGFSPLLLLERLPPEPTRSHQHGIFPWNSLAVTMTLSSADLGDDPFIASPW